MFSKRDRLLRSLDGYSGMSFLISMLFSTVQSPSQAWVVNKEAGGHVLYRCFCVVIVNQIAMIKSALPCFSILSKMRLI